MTEGANMTKVHYSYIPCSKSRALLERRASAVPKGISSIKRETVALVEDVDGNVFIDFAGAIGTLNVEQSHPLVVKAATQFIHTGFNVMMYDSYIKLSERLATFAPIEGEKQVAF